MITRHTDNLLRAVPVLHVSDAAAAESFYCGKLGFEKAFEYRPAGSNPAYIGLKREAVWLHVSSFSGDGASGAVASIIVKDVDALFLEFTGRGVAVDLPPTDQTWGTREMYLRDPAGNSIRFQQIGG